MEEHALGQSNRRLGWAWVLACLGVTGLFVVACLAIFLAVERQSIPVIKDYFPTLTPSSTPAPHFLVHPPGADAHVLQDDFSSNRNRWSLYYGLSKAEVRDGKLFLEEFSSNSVAVGICYCQFPMDEPYTNPYYLQADFSTDSQTSGLYGLVFNLTDENDFYVFTIDATGGRYYLEKSVSGEWVSLYSGSAPDIKAYPAVNTLSVYFDRGDMQLYINGNLVESYKDRDPVNLGQIGVIIAQDGVKLIVDNLFAYHK